MKGTLQCTDENCFADILIWETQGNKSLFRKSESEIRSKDIWKGSDEKQSKTQLDFGVRFLLRFCTERCSTIRVKGYSNVRLKWIYPENDKNCFTEYIIKWIKEKHDRYPKNTDNFKLSGNSKGILQCTSLIICPTTVFHED